MKEESPTGWVHIPIQHIRSLCAVVCRPTMASLFQQILEDKYIQNLRGVHNTSIHVAFIVRRGQIIAKAVNSIGSRSRGCGYSDMTIHAERAVVKQLGDFQQLRGASLYVVRIKYGANNGEHGIVNSEPCHDCHLFLKKCHDKYGLSRVFYSTHEFVEMDYGARPAKRPPMVPMNNTPLTRSKC